MNRTAVFVVTIGLILFAVIEGASYLIGALIFPSSVIFRPSFSNAEQADLQKRYVAYLDTRNPHTGLPLNEQSYRLLTEIAFEELTKRGLVPDSTAPADSTTASN